MRRRESQPRKKRPNLHTCTCVECALQTVGCCSLLINHTGPNTFLHFFLLGCSSSQTKYYTSSTMACKSSSQNMIHLRLHLPLHMPLLFGMPSISSTHTLFHHLYLSTSVSTSSIVSPLTRSWLCTSTQHAYNKALWDIIATSVVTKRTIFTFKYSRTVR